MFNFGTWALHRQQIGWTLRSVFWTDNSCFHRWNLGFQKRNIEVYFWRTTNLRSLVLMDNRILPTSKFGFVEKTNPSSFRMWSWVKCFFNFGIWVWGDKYFQLGDVGLGEMKCCQLWNLGLEGFSLEMWVWCRKQIFPTLPFVFWGQQQTLSTFAPLGSARTPFPSNFHDLAASRPPTIRFEVFAWEVLQKSTLNQTRFL